jgi:hypothetical protein
MEVEKPFAASCRDQQAGSLRSPESECRRDQSWSIQCNEIEFRNKSGMVSFD